MTSLREAAREGPCTIRLPGCRQEEGNRFLCHRRGAGMALKSDDEDACIGCHWCHLKIDGPMPDSIYDEIFDSAKRRTHAYFKRKGVL